MVVVDATVAAITAAGALCSFTWGAGTIAKWLPLFSAGSNLGSP